MIYSILKTLNMTTKIIITFMFLNSFVSFATIKNENKEMKKLLSEIGELV